MRIVVMRAHDPPRHRRRLPGAATARCSRCSTRELARHREFAPRRCAASTWSRCSPSRGAFLAERPRTGRELRAALAERVPRRRRRRRSPTPAATCWRCVQVPPRGVWGAYGAGHVDHRGGLARPPAGANAVARRRRAALPRRVRPGDGRRRRDVVTADRAARGRRAAAAAAAHLPRRARPRAVRPARRAAARSRRRPRRCASCPSTTTCCSRTPTVRRFISERAARHVLPGVRARPRGRSCTTASASASGGSSARRGARRQLRGAGCEARAGRGRRRGPTVSALPRPRRRTARRPRRRDRLALAVGAAPRHRLGPLGGGEVERPLELVAAGQRVRQAGGEGVAGSVGVDQLAR